MLTFIDSPQYAVESKKIWVVTQRSLKPHKLAAVICCSGGFFSQTKFRLLFSASYAFY